MNSGLFDGLEQLLGTDAEGISHVFIHYNKVFLSIIILALTINCIETVVKAVKYSRQERKLIKLCFIKMNCVVTL